VSQKVLISRAHRDALYHETLLELSEFDDLRREYESERPDLEACKRIGRRTTDALRLIQDGGLGWGYAGEAEPTGRRKEVELTLPAAELRRVIVGKRSMLAKASQMRQGEREDKEWEWEQLEKAREACSAILDQLAGAES
jgi:hypothetical protein